MYKVRIHNVYLDHLITDVDRVQCEIYVKSKKMTDRSKDKSRHVVRGYSKCYLLMRNVHFITTYAQVMS